MRRVLLLTALSAAACWDFDAAVDRCKANPSLCVSGTGGSTGNGEAASVNGCTDGQDNDGDGKTDCADTDCDGVTCRAAAMGGCDVAEVCTQGACPSDGFAAATVECRAARDVCDVAELCTGASAACPIDALDQTGKQCRPDAGPCEAIARCDGVSPSCPGRSFLGAGKVCRPVMGACDIEERCDATGPDCPTDRFLDDSVPCRAASGKCDVEDHCAGDAGSCPVDGIADAGEVCRSSIGSCDRSEVCTGLSTACPPDVTACPMDQFCTGSLCVPKLDAGVGCSGDVQCLSGSCADSVCCNTPCAGECDACDRPGSLGTCSLLPSTAVCRPAAGGCDLPETCSGASAQCPADALRDAGSDCRPAASACDVAEVCTGVSPGCPSDEVVGSTVVCRADAGICDITERCDGFSNQCPTDGFLGTSVVCRAGGNNCDAPETCTGSSSQCPADQLFDAGTPCGPASCFNGQLSPAPACQGAACVPGAPTSCGGFGCNGMTMCLGSCSGAVGCASSHFCDGGTCQPKPGLGTPCVNPGDCLSGFCANGRCCDRDCSGNCEGCTDAGFCTPAPAGTDPGGGCGTYTCNGQGGCFAGCNGGLCAVHCKQGNYCSTGICVGARAQNSPCTLGCECASTFCFDGKCCDRSCGSGCETCTSGTCARYAAGSDPEVACGQYTCNGDGGCFSNCSGAPMCGSTQCKASAFCTSASCTPKIANGLPCTLANACDCQSGVCSFLYVDSDGDMVGTGAGAYRCGSGGNGYALATGDCCDTDSLVKPGQTSYFTSASNCGSYDYNCVNGVEQQYPEGFGCIFTPPSGVCAVTLDADCTGSGWTGAVPACGAPQASYRSCSPHSYACGVTCGTITMSMERQGCR